MTSLLEYLDKDCEMTVFPQPNAPGIAVVPPCTHLKEKSMILIRKHLVIYLFSQYTALATFSL